jgi:hypothetical protein
MRHSLLACLTATVLLSLPLVAHAQDRRPLLIDKVRVGYLANQAADGLFKAGAWTPVYVDVTAGMEGLPNGADIIVESADSDDVGSRYMMKLPPLEPKDQYTLLTYTRPGSIGSEIKVTAWVNDRRAAEIDDHYGAIELGNQLYVSIGGRLHELRNAWKAPNQQEEELTTKETGPRRTAVIDDIRMLPNRWFAYEPVDLMFLTTGNRDFLTALLNEREDRKTALAEWVRRGGRLVVSVARNQDMVAKLEPLASMLPVTINGIVQKPELHSVERWAGPQQRRFQNPRPRANPNGERPPVEIAKLERKPGREIDELITESDGSLVAVTSAYGLGQITVVAFDLDEPPFTSWQPAAQRDFWKKFVELRAPTLKAEQNPQPGMPGYYQQQSNDLASQLETNLEEFPDVPVISFGWVALFILVYILIVGPLDYFFLKKVVKRLELTWITFPTVVIAISVIAYFTAYWLKGNDQRTNKVDLAYVDLETKQTYGTTWFTIFSPRIQHYTIGLEPGAAGWAPANVTPPVESSVNLTWMGRPEAGWGGSGRSRSQGLFRRAYDYVNNATALVGVPIQVWSTKSFSASWQVPLDPNQPIISANLRHASGKSEAIPSGTITSHLAVPLEDVVMFHHGQNEDRWYSLDRLVPNVPKRIDAVKGGTPMEQWLAQTPSDALAKTSQHTPRPGIGGSTKPTISVIKQIAFNRYDRSGSRNTALNHLDLGWRLSHKDEVIVFGRLAHSEGQAEEVVQSAGAPSRLWLGTLPGSGQPRPPLVGTLTQESYVCIIIPVKPTQVQ